MIVQSLKKIGSGIRDRIFKLVHGNNLVYNTCWEDPRVDRQLLEFNSDSKIVMITSAGCNALDYLLDNPARIDCVDMNSRQNSLLELKQVLYRVNDYNLLFDMFCNGHRKNIQVEYKEKIKPLLSPDSQSYWDKQIYFFKKSGLRHSFYFHSTSGTFAWLFKQYLKANPKLRSLMHSVIDAQTMEEQVKYYDLVEPLLMNRVLKWILKRQVTMAMLGVPRAQRQLMISEFPGGFSGYIAASMRNVFTGMPVTDNYFWRVYLKGSYSINCCPNYIKAEYFEQLAKNEHKIHTHTMTVTDFLKKNPGTYTHFILLDHMDWLAANLPDVLAEEWKFILKNSQKGTKILIRSASTGRAFLPQFALDALDFQDELTTRLSKQDRVGTYASTHLGIVK